jgi:hypothetical protein
MFGQKLTTAGAEFFNVRVPACGNDSHPVVEQDVVGLILAYNKIRVLIIRSVFVNVMNFCKWRNWLTESAFSHYQVFLSMFPRFIKNPNISAGQISPAIPVWVKWTAGAWLTFPRAVFLVVVLAMKNFFLSTAGLAGNNYGSHAVHPPVMKVWSGLLWSFAASKRAALFILSKDHPAWKIGFAHSLT